MKMCMVNSMFHFLDSMDNDIDDDYSGFLLMMLTLMIRKIINCINSIKRTAGTNWQQEAMDRTK